MNSATAQTEIVPDHARLEPMLLRLPPPIAERLRRLARLTRVRQSDYLREAVADLLAKYEHVIGADERS